jgi:hypothetical protein
LRQPCSVIGEFSGLSICAYQDTVKRERAAGFTHSHNDKVNYDSFDEAGMGTGAFKKDQQK